MPHRSVDCEHIGVVKTRHTYNRYTVDNSVEVRDLSGAGDTWMSSFVVKYLDTKIVDTAIDIKVNAAWQAGVKVLAAAVDEGYGDIVAFLGRKLVEARPDGVALPVEMSRIASFLRSV